MESFIECDYRGFTMEWMDDCEWCGAMCCECCGTRDIQVRHECDDED